MFHRGSSRLRLLPLFSCALRGFHLISAAEPSRALPDDASVQQSVIYFAEPTYLMARGIELPAFGKGGRTLLRGGEELLPASSHALSHPRDQSGLAATPLRRYADPGHAVCATRRRHGEASFLVPGECCSLCCC